MINQFLNYRFQLNYLTLFLNGYFNSLIIFFLPILKKIIHFGKKSSFIY